MRSLNNALSILLLVAIIVFAVQNLESVDVQFLVFALKMPKILLILLVFLFGMVSGWGLVDLLKKAMQNVSPKSSSSP